MPRDGVPAVHPKQEAGGGWASAAPAVHGETIGILAGGGGLPLILATELTASGRPVHIVAIEGHADAGVSAFHHQWINLGRIGGILASFHRAGCREIVIAGSMQRPDLLRLRIDTGFIRHLPTLLAMTRGGDDSVLRRVVGFFEGEGFIVRGVGELAPALQATPGPIGSLAPSGVGQAAIARAEAVIRALGPFDLGQGVVATSQRVIAVEGIRGTDAMLADLGPGGVGAGLGRGAVLVKLAKPGQEMRVDLPTIGPVTIERAAAADLAGIAVGAGSALVLERSVLAVRADSAGLFVFGISSRDTPAASDAADPRSQKGSPASPMTLLGRHAPTPSDRRDLALARRLLPILAAQGAGPAAVVAGEHVLAVAAALPLAEMLAPLAARNRWGLWALRGRVGTLALDLAMLPNPSDVAALLGIELFRAAREARLAGVTCVGAPIPESVKADVIAWANEARLFLMSEMP